MFTTFTTQRLSLSLVTENDHAFIQQLVNTDGWLRFIGDRNVHSKEEAVAYIRRLNAAGNYHYWVVRRNGESLGIVTYIKRDYLPHHDIGFAFLPAYAGKGYAYEAASALLLKLRSLPGHTTVLATTLPANTSSIKLLKKLGLSFQKELEVDAETLHVYATSGA